VPQEALAALVEAEAGTLSFQLLKSVAGLLPRKHEVTSTIAGSEPVRSGLDAIPRSKK